MMLGAPEILDASILIVDDEAANVKLLERVLEEPGLNTREQLLGLVSEVAKDPSTGNPQ